MSDSVDGKATSPRKVVVVGAGVVGLSTAWFLRSRGADVTVVDRTDVAAGASWGNAGYVAPGFSVPLPEPSVLRYGLRSLLDRDAPLYVPAQFDPGMWAFLAEFARHCTTRSWQRSMRSFVPVNSDSLDAFDELATGGVQVPSVPTTVTAAFRDAEEATDLRHEFESVRDAGQHMQFGSASPREVDVPQLSDDVAHVVRLEGQRYIDPGAFTFALADSLRELGGEVRAGFEVHDVVRDGPQVTVQSTSGDQISADNIVLATGAWLPDLAKKFGVRHRVRAGRGYSFTVPTKEPVPGPIYLPSVRVACLPYRGALRVAGTMEFRHPDDALDTERIEAIARSAKPFLQGVSWEERYDEWVGPRPVSADGLPLVGPSRDPDVHVAGGHGMWGLTLGPITGRLLAEQIMTGDRTGALRAFDPLR